VTNFRDIKYSNSVTYGELFLQNEYEMSCYNLDEADVAEQRARFDLYEKEVRAGLSESGTGAVDMCIKCRCMAFGGGGADMVHGAG
jgi:glycyl-tRNA synthetase alpha subunit